MALIACGECGRAVSDKAEFCVGCGAPLQAHSGIDLVPVNSKVTPPTRAQIKRRALLAVSALGLGVVLAGPFGRHLGNARLAAFLAALLIIAGLCAVLVLLVHAAANRR